MVVLVVQPFELLLLSISIFSYQNQSPWCLIDKINNKTEGTNFDNKQHGTNKTVTKLRKASWGSSSQEMVM